MTRTVLITGGAGGIGREFCKQFNAKTQQQQGVTIPVEITVYADRSFSFETKTPPAAVLILKEAKLAKGSGEPNKTKVGRIRESQVRKIAEIKLPDLNTDDVNQAMRTIAGSAQSMGVLIDGEF